MIKYNVGLGQLSKWPMFYETGAVWSFLGLFLVGTVLARKQFFSTRFKNMSCIIAALFLAFVAASVFLVRTHYISDLEPFMHRWALNEDLGRISQFCIVGIYLVAGMLVYRFAGGRFILKPFVACGRASLSLSLYIMQSLIFAPIFYGFGLKLHESIGQSAALAFGIVAWVAQMLLANFWLKRFSYGPLEALWCNLTRLKNV